MLVALLSQTDGTKHDVFFPWSFNLLKLTGYLMHQQLQRSKTVLLPTLYSFTSDQDRQCTYNLTLGRVRATTVSVEKQLSIAHSECVSVALVIQHATRMHHIILSSVVGAAVLDFSTLSHKRHDFRK